MNRRLTFLPSIGVILVAIGFWTALFAATPPGATCIGTAVQSPSGDWAIVCAGSCSGTLLCTPTQGFDAGIGGFEYCPTCITNYLSCCKIICTTGETKSKLAYGVCESLNGWCDPGECSQEVSDDDEGNNTRYVAYCH